MKSFYEKTLKKNSVSMGTVLFLAALTLVPFVLACFKLKFSFSIFCLLSAISFAGGVLKLVCDILFNKGVSLKNKLIYPILFLFLSLFDVTYAVLSHGCETFGEFFKKIFEALISCFLNFAADGNFQDVLSAGEAIVLVQCGKGESVLFGICYMILVVLAPVAGGAVLIDIVSSIFPNLLLHLKNRKSKTNKHIFSELNERSIELAESIRDKFPEAMIIFADTDISDEKEGLADLAARIRKIGAVYVDEDISNLNIVGRKQTAYYLMSEQVHKNMHILAKLTSDEKHKELWRGVEKVSIRVFSDGSAVDMMADRINQQMKNENIPTEVFIVREYDILIYELLEKQPLYKPLLKNPKDSLSVVVVGSGIVARKFIRIAYWLGQMLNPAEKEKGKVSPVKLSFNIISLDGDKLKSRLQRSMPEAFSNEFCNNGGSFKMSHYARFNFFKADVNSYDFTKAIDEIEEIDYVLVALGDDGKNADVSRRLKKQIDRKYLGKDRTVVINSIVESDELQEHFENENKLTEAGTTKTELNFFGCLNDRFTYYNVVGERYKEVIDRALQTFEEAQEEAKKEDSNEAVEKKVADFNGQYNQKSDVASAYSRKTKEFSLGFYDENGKFKTDIDFSKLDRETVNDYVAKLLWLEKRRWNAYTRSIGYCAPTSKQMILFYEKYHEKMQDKLLETHKLVLEGSKEKLDLFNLHVCLLEKEEVSDTLLFEKYEKAALEADSEKLISCLEALIENKFSYQKFSKAFSCVPLAEDRRFESLDEFCEKYPRNTDLIKILFVLSGVPDDNLDDLDRLGVFNRKDYVDYDYKQLKDLLPQKEKKSETLSEKKNTEEIKEELTV